MEIHEIKGTLPSEEKSKMAQRKRVKGGTERYQSE